MIIRVFKAQIKEGKEDEFKEFFLKQALPRVRSQPGLVSAVIGTPLKVFSRGFVMIMIWENIASIRNYVGEHWYEPRIDPAEVDLLESVDVCHYQYEEG